MNDPSKKWGFTSSMTWSPTNQNGFNHASCPFPTNLKVEFFDVTGLRVILVQLSYIKSDPFKKVVKHQTILFFQTFWWCFNSRLNTFFTYLLSASKSKSNNAQSLPYHVTYDIFACFTKMEHSPVTDYVVRKLFITFGKFHFFWWNVQFKNTAFFIIPLPSASSHATTMIKLWLLFIQCF